MTTERGLGRVMHWTRWWFMYIYIFAQKSALLRTLITPSPYYLHKRCAKGWRIEEVAFAFGAGVAAGSCEMKLWARLHGINNKLTDFAIKIDFFPLRAPTVMKFYPFHAADWNIFHGASRALSLCVPLVRVERGELPASTPAAGNRIIEALDSFVEYRRVPKWPFSGKGCRFNVVNWKKFSQSDFIIFCGWLESISNYN